MKTTQPPLFRRDHTMKNAMDSLQDELGAVRTIIRAIVKWALADPVMATDEPAEKPANGHHDVAEPIAPVAPAAASTSRTAGATEHIVRPDAVALDETGVSNARELHRLWRVGAIPKITTVNVRGQVVRGITREWLGRVTTKRGGFRVTHYARHLVSQERPMPRKHTCVWCAQPLASQGAWMHVAKCAKNHGETTNGALEKLADSSLAFVLDNGACLGLIEGLDRKMANPVAGT